MDNTPIEDRRFSDKELKEILKRAVEDTARSGALTRQEGHSLADLRAIAQEVGIDPARIEDAARSVAERGAKGGFHLFGGPLKMTHERTVPGTIAPELAPDVLATIRREFGVHGEASEIQGSLDWTAKGEIGERRVTVRSLRGETRVVAGANLGQTALVSHLPASIIGLMATIITMVTSAEAGNPFGVVAGLLILPTIHMVARTIYGKVASAEVARLERAVDEVTRMAEDADPGVE